jgi:DNA-directed RNA polymerase specialized sigma24 family protein
MDDKRGRFEAEVLPHLNAAYRFARWLAHSPGDADDLVQEAILRAFRGFDAALCRYRKNTMPRMATP